MLASSSRNVTVPFRRWPSSEVGTGRELIVRSTARLWWSVSANTRRTSRATGPQWSLPVRTSQYRGVEIGDTLGGAYVVSERHDGAFLESLDMAVVSADGYDGWQIERAKSSGAENREMRVMCVRGRS